MIPDFFEPRLRRLVRDILTRDGRISPEGWVVRKLIYPDGTIEVVVGKNLVTDAGDLWYAQRAMTETPTNAFVNAVLGTGSATPGKASTYSNITPIAGSNKAPSATYPKRNDTDADNSAKAVDSVTWKYEFAAADFNQAAGISEGVVTIAAPSAGSPLLAFWQWAPTFGKDSSTQLVVYVNHNFLGV